MGDHNTSKSPSTMNEVFDRREASAIISRPRPSSEIYRQRSESPRNHGTEPAYPSTSFETTHGQELHDQDGDVEDTAEISLRSGQPTIAVPFEEEPTSNTRTANFVAVEEPTGIRSQRKSWRNNWRSSRQSHYTSNLANPDVLRFFLRSSWKGRLGRVVRFHRQRHSFRIGTNQRMSTAMALFATVGLGAAVSHHLLNNALHGQQVKIADWIQRFGTALAFFVTVCLVWAVEIAYTQQAWVGDSSCTIMNLH